MVLGIFTVGSWFLSSSLSSLNKRSFVTMSNLELWGVEHEELESLELLELELSESEESLLSDDLLGDALLLSE